MFAMNWRTLRSYATLKSFYSDVERNPDLQFDYSKLILFLNMWRLTYTCNKERKQYKFKDLRLFTHKDGDAFYQW